uniref:Feminizer male variant n=4 Tax=Meliponini TaxID=83319 RepID=A0A7D0N428_9HYME|nr:feminizer male variant [Frieseomelitta varia]
MKRIVSSHSHRDERSRTSRSGDFETGLRSKTEEERLRRRREWMIEQEKLREHEKLKAKMILEYEIRRAREKGLPPPKGRFSHHSRSKSKSKSPEIRHKTTTSSTSKTAILSKKLEPSDGTTPLFKGPEGTQVSIVELRSIKVDIHRNVPGKATTDELQRAIVNPEDVQVMRREG